MQVKRVAGEQGNRARALMSQLSGLLTEGAVTADTLLDSVPRILSVVRESNVALRWLFLHMAALPPAVALVIKPLTQSLQLSLPDPSCVRMNSHQPLPKNTSSQNHSLQHKRSRQLADYAKEAAGITQEQLFQLLLQVTPLTEPHCTALTITLSRWRDLSSCCEGCTRRC